jgi:ABC-type branched-subunit amino acid transport system permease subunit
MSGVHDNPNNICKAGDNSKDCNTNDCRKHYDGEIANRIRMVYIIGAILWLVLIFFLGLWTKQDIMVWLFLFLPLIVYGINYLSLGEFTCNMEDQMFRGNFLSFGFIVAILLIHWDSPLDNPDGLEFFKILITAFILLMLSLLDIWVGEWKMPIVKHIKTSLHTASLSLLALSLYLYYTYQRDHGITNTIA